jgi:hypothetical protein
MMTIQIDIKVVDGEDEKIFENEILFDQPDLDVDRIKAELIELYQIPVYRIRIKDYWQSEQLQSTIIAESSGLCDEQTRGDSGILFEYNDFEELDPEPLPE